MAQTPVTLKVDDFAEREVLKVSYVFERATDIEGQLAGLARGGRINIRVKALNDGNPEMYSWMTDQSMRKKGEIIFKETMEFKEMKKIEFDGAYCIQLEEKWEEGMIHTEEIQIVCQSITFAGNVQFTNEWA